MSSTRAILPCKGWERARLKSWWECPVLAMGVGSKHGTWIQPRCFQAAPPRAQIPARQAGEMSHGAPPGGGGGDEPEDDAERIATICWLAGWSTRQSSIAGCGRRCGRYGASRAEVVRDPLGETRPNVLLGEGRDGGRSERPSVEHMLTVNRELVGLGPRGFDRCGPSATTRRTRWGERRGSPGLGTHRVGRQPRTGRGCTGATAQLGPRPLCGFRG